MPGKMARSGCPTAVRARECWQQSRHRAPVLWEARENATIHSDRGFIWGIADWRKTDALVRCCG